MALATFVIRAIPTIGNAKLIELPLLLAPSLPHYRQSPVALTGGAIFVSLLLNCSSCPRRSLGLAIIPVKATRATITVSAVLAIRHGQTCVDLFCVNVNLLPSHPRPAVIVVSATVTASSTALSTAALPPGRPYYPSYYHCRARRHKATAVIIAKPFLLYN